MVKKSQQINAGHPASLSNVAFDILSQIDLRQLKSLQKPEFLIFARDKEVKDKEVITYKDVKLRVAGTRPYGAGKITKDTLIEILFRPTVIPSDIIFAINASYSMKFKDFKPSKFEAVVSALRHLLEKRLEYDFNDRIGIISFSHDWYQVSELHQITQKYIDDVVGALGKTRLQGRASVSGAISGAADMFKLEGDGKRARILVLMTDTIEDMFGNPVERVKRIGNNIIIYPLIIDGQEALETNAAAEIAEITSGKVYHLTTQEKLEMILLDMADHFRIVPNDSSVSGVGTCPETPGKTGQGRRGKETAARQRAKEGAESIIMVGDNAANELPASATGNDEEKDESTTIKTLKMIKRALWD